MLVSELLLTVTECNITTIVLDIQMHVFPFIELPTK
jgi:hypothetical protein